MNKEENPFAAPIADQPQNVVAGEYVTPAEFSPEGLPHPILLGWIGILLAVAVFAGLFYGYFHYLVLLGIIGARIGWVVYAKIQMRRHSHTWSPGIKSFVTAAWAMNLIVLCFDAVVVCFLITCLGVL